MAHPPKAILPKMSWIGRWPSVVIGILALLAACATPPSQTVRSEPSAREPILTVAILPFESHAIGNDLSTAGLDRRLPDRIAEGLTARPGLRLVERELLQEILGELSLSSGELVGSENRLRLGQLLGAHYFVMGGYTAIGSLLRIDGRIVEVESGLVEGVSEEGALQDREVEERFVKKLVDRVTSKTIASEGGTP